MNLKEMVEEILKTEQKGRDSDQWLTLKIWAVFFPEVIDRTDPANPKIALTDVMKMPREDNVKRYRAMFQNDLGLYPASPAVAKKRGQEEIKKRNEFGTNPLYTD